MKAKSRVRRAAAVPSRAIVETACLDPVKLRVLADPVRSFIVYSLVPRAKTVKETGRGTRLSAHAALLPPAATREARPGVRREHTARLGIVEKHYRAVARDWVLDRSGLDARGRGGPDRLEALLAFVFDQSRQEIRRQVEQGAIELGGVRRSAARCWRCATCSS